MVVGCVCVCGGVCAITMTLLGFFLLFFFFNVGKNIFMELLFAHITPKTQHSKHLLK